MSQFNRLYGGLTLRTPAYMHSNTNSLAQMHILTVALQKLLPGVIQKMSGKK